MAEQSAGGAVLSWRCIHYIQSQANNNAASSHGAHAGADGGTDGPSSNTRSKTSAGVATESHPLKDAEVIEINTTGIHPPPGKEFLVIFHVLIPLFAWDSKITASDVSLRFGHHTLGNWQTNIGEFKLVREVNQGVIEVECRLTMNYDILKSQTSVHYKYVVNTSTRKGGEYEYLHGAPGGDGIKNRCFKVTRQEAERERVYHQYDNMAFPQTKERHSIMQKFIARKDFVTRSASKKEELVVPNHETMQSWALETYFEQYKTILSECKISSSLNIEAATTKILHIFNTLYLYRVSNEQERLFPWKCETLSEIFVGHLISIVTDLYELEIKGALENGKRMSSVLVILCCLHHIIMIPSFFKMNQIYPQNKSALLYMLRLMPDPVQRKCLDWEYLMNMIPPKFKTTVYEAVLGFTVNLGHTEHLSKPQWLYSVPLVHLLGGAIQPFQEMCLNPSEVPWVDELIDLRTIRSKTYLNEYGIVKYMFSELMPLTELDPSLLYCFVYICPRKELPQLFSHLPPFLSMAFCAKLLEDSRTYNREDVQEAIKHLTSIADFMRSHMETRFRLLTPTLDASFYLLTETMSKLGSSQKNYRLEFLRRSIELVLESVKFMKLFETNNRDTKIALNEQSAGALKKLFNILNKYFKEIVSESFGMQQQSWFGKQAVEEVKIWNTFFPMKISCNEVKSMWENDVIAKIVESRIDKVALGKRFDLFCSLESVLDTHGIITNAFLNAVMDEIVSTEDIERLISSSTLQKRSVGKIIDKILAKRYPPNKESISLDELLDWDMWKTFIKIHKNEAMMSNSSVYGLSEQCALLCMCAESTLDGVCTRIRNGEVTLEEISLLKKKKNHVEVLLAENESKKADGEQLKQLLHQRFDELEEYRERVVLLGQVCQSLTEPVKGLDQLLAEIKKDTSKTPIKVLCVKKAEKFSFLSLESAFPLDDIKIKFDIMLKQNLFSKIWNERMKTAATAKRKSGSELIIPDIKTEIWEPTFIECQTLLDSLRERTIQLSAVDRYFKSVDQKKRMIQSLYAGVEKCMNNGVHDHDPRWITVAVDLMDRYLSLCELAEVADIVLNLKGKLGLTGDFTLIETLSIQVTSSMGNKPLSSISDELIQAGEFLKDLSDNPAKLECLKTFASSMKIVEWIRNETTEVNSLHKFVSVALHMVAGEGDLASDKLSHLKMIGTGFGSLIYDLKNDPSFETFKTSCKKVWKAMEQTPHLLRLLKDCNNEVEWFTSVKLKQGSVEVTSYDQMNEIVHQLQAQTREMETELSDWKQTQHKFEEIEQSSVDTQEPMNTISSHASGTVPLTNEIMKSADIHASASSDVRRVYEDMPTLTEDDLSIDEKAIMANIMANIMAKLNCSKFLVLKAFEECRGKEMNEYDYLNWCNDNSEKYEFEEEGDFKDKEESESDDQSSSSSDSESESGCIEETATTPIHWSGIIKREASIQELVDEHHPIGKDLISAGYTVQQSIEAVEKCETLEVSLNCIDSLAAEDNDEEEVEDLIPSYKIKQSSVDTQEPMDTISSRAPGTVPLMDEIMKSADIHTSTCSDVGRAGYTVQQSMKAVKRDYIDSLAAKDDDERELISSYKYQLSREDSHPQDDFKKDWKNSDPPSIHTDSRAEERHEQLALKQLQEKNQRIDETVSQEQEGLKRRQRLDQNVIPDTDHDSNKKERVITSEDEGHVLSHDERLKEKYKFRDHHVADSMSVWKKRIPVLIVLVGVIFAVILVVVGVNFVRVTAFICNKLNPNATIDLTIQPIQEKPLASPSTTLADPNKVKKLNGSKYPIIHKKDLFMATEEFSDWYGLCTYLKVDEAIMNQLEESTMKSITQKKRICLTSYYNNCKPSWNDVVGAISDLKNKRLACKIAMEHMEWEEKDCEVELSM